MRILIIQHADRGTPGSLGDYLNSIHAQVVTKRIFASEPLPSDPNEFDAVVSLGGYMHPDQERQFPFLIDEDVFLRKAVAAQTPVLGICLGAQLLAKALDTRVYQAPKPEIGFFPVTLTERGKVDSVFNGFPDRFTVALWHRYTYDLPQGAKHLAASELCPHQAFRFGNALAIQFHIEVNRKKLNYWIESTSDRSEECHSERSEESQNPYIDFDSISKDFQNLEPRLLNQAHILYNNFFNQ